jgi:hypothetical protein
MEPLAVTPKQCWAALGVGKTKGWELVARGELKSFKVDGATRITTESVRAYVARQLDQREVA